jgi:imidazolonepropionase-like amidohydrolase
MLPEWSMATDRRWHGGLGDPRAHPVPGLRAARLIDGSGGPIIQDGVVRVSGDTISYCGPASDDPERETAPLVDLGDRTLMPGLIDCHLHPRFYPGAAPETDSFGAVDHAGSGWTSEIRALESASASWRALMSGVTTIRIPGLPGRTAFALRDAIDQGTMPGPRTLIAGRVICPTGGHGHNGGEEADGPDGVRRAARLMFKNGADFVKLTATGGGTARTVRGRATLTVEELAAAANEASQHDSYATAHVHGTEGIVRCLDAGIQMLEHATFVGDDGLEHFDRDVGTRIRDQDVPVVPTVQVNGRILESPDGERALGQLDPAEQRTWTRRRESFKRRIDLVAQLHDLGVTVLMGSDGGGRPAPVDDLAYGLELHVRAGIDPMAVLQSATSTAADRLGLGTVTGRLRAGLCADILAVPGDPVRDITSVGRVDLVISRGTIVRGPALLLAPAA